MVVAEVSNIGWLAILASGGAFAAAASIVSAWLGYRYNLRAKDAESKTAEHASTVAEKAAAVDGLERALEGVLKVNEAHTKDLARQGTEMASQRLLIVDLREKLDECEAGRTHDRLEYSAQMRELTDRVRELEGAR